MRHIEVLDCTLRDGGYLVHKNFGDSIIRGVINGLLNAGVDYIEIGFLQNENCEKGDVVFKNTEDAMKYIPQTASDSCFALFADYSRYSTKYLNEYKGEGVNTIRECFFKHERKNVLEEFYNIVSKGYKLFIQPVDILGYSDKEIIEFIESINSIEPFCLSIVDTFGSMYLDDLHRVFEIISHNLNPSCRIGFHSHNNMQLSNALSQEFVKMAYGKRNVVIDGTLAGMGRGAGNTPIEMIVAYIQRFFNGTYNIDYILDMLDSYINYLKTQCSWGYSTEYFIAGVYGAHVNNVSYLTKKNCIKSKEICQILDGMEINKKKRYDYDLLDHLFTENVQHDVDDSNAMKNLAAAMTNKKILILVPGRSLKLEKDRVKKYISENAPVVIGVNFISDEFKMDYIYFNNINRYLYWSNNDELYQYKRILGSNIKRKAQDTGEYIFSIGRVLSQGDYADNSTLMLLRLMDCFDVYNICLAGFDGYSRIQDGANYILPELELDNVYFEPEKRNHEIERVLSKHMKMRKKRTPISFITESKFKHVIHDEEAW